MGTNCGKKTKKKDYEKRAVEGGQKDFPKCLI